MGLNIAFQMDPLETINIDTDSSFMMSLEALKRGIRCSTTCAPIGAGRQSVERNGPPLHGEARTRRHFAAGAAERIDLGRLDLVMMRQDPPFDMSYITATHMLEHIQPGTLVLNDPASVRNAPEKLFVTISPT